jgi:hypothetical protein
LKLGALPAFTGDFRDLMTDQRNRDDRVDEGRRSFIRKAAYTAPALVTLGAAMSSDDASAQCDPFVDPNCNPPTGPITFEPVDEREPEELV